MGSNAYPVSINQATVRQRWTLRQAIEGCARHGVRGIATWRDKLQECGIKEAARMIADHGLTVTGHLRAGMFPAATPEGRRAAIDDNKRAIDEAAGVKAQCLVLLGGAIPPGSKDIAGARRMFVDGLAEVLPYARAAGVPMAVEPLHPMYAADRACINTLGQANDICDELGEGCGIAYDVYHLWWDPNLKAETKRAGKRILGFHVCDWLVPTNDFLTDRGMMGDGVIDIPLIRSWVEEAGYQGFCEVEILSSRWWAEDPDKVVELCVERCRTAC
jgi:sugar phosphate isomerase/epimerase